MAGGNYYKVELTRSVVFDRACSCKACGHVCELLIIIVCFLSIVGVFIFLINSKVMEKERKVRNRMQSNHRQHSVLQE